MKGGGGGEERGAAINLRTFAPAQCRPNTRTSSWSASLKNNATNCERAPFATIMKETTQQSDYTSCLCQSDMCRWVHGARVLSSSEQTKPVLPCLSEEPYLCLTSLSGRDVEQTTENFQVHTNTRTLVLHAVLSTAHLLDQV